MIETLFYLTALDICFCLMPLCVAACCGPKKLDVPSNLNERTIHLDNGEPGATHQLFVKRIVNVHGVEIFLNSSQTVTCARKP